LSAMPAAQFAERLAREGVLIGPAGGRRLRAVTHCAIERGDIEETVTAVKKVLGS
jgi:threonine aldolase